MVKTHHVKHHKHRGFAGFENMIVAAIGVVIAVVLFLSVTQGVVNTALNGSTTVNMSGYSSANTVAGMIPLVLVVTVLLLMLGVAVSWYKG